MKTAEFKVYLKTQLSIKTLAAKTFKNGLFYPPFVKLFDCRRI